MTTKKDVADKLARVVQAEAASTIKPVTQMIGTDTVQSVEDDRCSLTSAGPNFRVVGGLVVVPGDLVAFTRRGTDRIVIGVIGRNALDVTPSGDGGSGSTDAADIGIADAGGHFTATDVEAALAELFADLATHALDTTSVHGITDTSALYAAGGTDVAVADGGTGAGTASSARTNLGVAYGATGDMSASAVGDTVAAGSAGKVADAGHRHAREAFATPGIALGTAAAAGSAATPIRSDATIAAFDATAPSTQAFGDSAAAGSAAVAARRDHKHAMPSERAASSTTPAAVGTAAVGTGTTDARSDHVHATGAGTPSTQAIGDAAATGSGPAAAMTDHKHAMPAFASPVAVGTANAAGSAATLPHSDHVHKGEWDGVITKGSNESVTSSTALQNDDDFAVAFTTGKVYFVEFLLAIDGSAAGDIKMDFGEDGTVRGSFSLMRLTTADAAANNAVEAQQGTTIGAGTAATPRGVYIFGTYTSAGGTFRLRWAQNVSDATATRILAGSLMRYRQIN